jgi:hypothetical protein
VSYSSPGEAPQYQTELAQTPLSEILVKVDHYKVPGRLDCSSGDVLKRVYLENGQVIFATTNQTAESLGDRLLAAERITHQQYVESLHRSKETLKRHGEALVDMQMLTPEELFVSVREQIEEIVWSLFSWQSGSVAFTPGRDKHQEFVKVDIPIAKAVLRGVRRAPDARLLIARIGTKATIFEKSDKPVDFALAADERAMLKLANGKRTLIELVKGNSDNARILYGLFVTGLIRAKEGRRIKVQLKTQ